MQSYLKQDNVATNPHNFILFELDFDLKFPLLRFLLFLSDLKSTISCQRLAQSDLQYPSYYKLKEKIKTRHIPPRNFAVAVIFLLLR